MTIKERIAALPEDTPPITSIYPEFLRIDIADVKTLAASHTRLLGIASEVANAADDSVTPWNELRTVIEEAEKL